MHNVEPRRDFMTDLDGRDAGRRGSAPPASRLRASDADRHAAVMTLQDAMARGLLTPDEASERMGTAFAAVYLSDLGVLIADLPAANPGRARAPGWAALATLTAEQVRSSLMNAAGRRDPVRVAAALLVVLLLATAFGVLVAGLFDTGFPPGPGAYGRHY